MARDHGLGRHEHKRTGFGRRFTIEPDPWLTFMVARADHGDLSDVTSSSITPQRAAHAIDRPGAATPLAKHALGHPSSGSGTSEHDRPSREE